MVIDARWGSLGGVEVDEAREPGVDVEAGVDGRSRRGRGGGREPACHSGLCGLVVRRRRDAIARDALAPRPRARPPLLLPRRDTYDAIPTARNARRPKLSERSRFRSIAPNEHDARPDA